MTKNREETEHIPVMLNECMEGLNIKDNGKYIDCTIGGAGHSSVIMQRANNVHLLGFDADPLNFQRAKERLSQYGENVHVVNTNFSNLKQTVSELEFFNVNGILFDLGLSSMQLAEDAAGFSFQFDAPLDMRFSPDQKLTAADIINEYSEENITNILFDFGEETFSRKLARAIIDNRPIMTTKQLADLIVKVLGNHGKIHPATKTFQALRIAVNNELEVLKDALEQSLDVLGENGRLVIMSYHSLEDRIVKNFIKEATITCRCPKEIPVCQCHTIPTLRQITHKVITPGEGEIKNNPRARSAKLRIAERINKDKSIRSDY